jgi:thioredoxin-related protein
METGTFLQESVRENIGKYFVPIKYESGRDAEQFYRFAITQTPTYVILNPGGDEVFRMTGYYGADEFIGKMGEARAKAGAKDV